jgi:hypothetical protein
MRQLLSLMLVLWSVSAFAQTQLIELNGVEDFPADMLTSLGSFECTGGGYPTGLFECSEGSGIHIRNLEGYTCLLTSELEVIGTTWFDLNANWDEQYTGPVFGNWIVVLSDVCARSVVQDPESYFVGTYTGKRRLEMEALGPVWIGEWKLDGWGVGIYSDVQFKSKNKYRMFTALPLPFELTGMGTGPEGVFAGKMIFHEED